jgi:hypothetical protein
MKNEKRPLHAEEEGAGINIILPTSALSESGSSGKGSRLLSAKRLPVFQAHRQTTPAHIVFNISTALHIVKRSIRKNYRRTGPPLG